MPLGLLCRLLLLQCVENALLPKLMRSTQRYAVFQQDGVQQLRETLWVAGMAVVDRLVGHLVLRISQKQIFFWGGRGEGVVKYAM